MSSSKKKFSIASILGVGGIYPWKTHSFELLKKSVEAAVRKVPQKMDFYIIHVVSIEPTTTTTTNSHQQTTSSSSPLPTCGIVSSTSSSPNTILKGCGSQHTFPSFPPSPYRSGGIVGPSPPCSSSTLLSSSPVLSSETLLNDIIWLGKTLSNLLTLAEMQKPSGHESDHTKRTAFEAFMGLVSHLNGSVQRLYVNYMVPSETIIDYVKAKKMVNEHPEYESVGRAFEIGELARKSSNKMTASSIYLILSQLLRGLTENPKICEWLFCDEDIRMPASSYSPSSYLCGANGGSGGGNVYY